MLILGLNAYHGDASACLVKDGEVLAAIEEERLSRVKHAAGFPARAIQSCLEIANVNVRDIDVVSLAKDPSANLSGRLLRVAQKLKTPKKLFSESKRFISGTQNLQSQIADAADVNVSELKMRAVPVEHHLAHVASAFYYGTFEEAVGVSIDGLGDNVSTLITHCDGNGIARKAQVAFPHSLGFFYTAMTQYLGFPNYGDEYKVMGLAAAGSPRFLPQLRKVLLRTDDGLFKLALEYFLHHTGEFEMTWSSGAPVLSNLYSASMEDLMGPARTKQEGVSQVHKDIACSVQAMYEEILLHVLDHAHRQGDSDNLVMAGGCSQNSLANGRIPFRAGFKNVYTPPSGHDGGTAVGAALFTSVKQGKPSIRQRSAYLGGQVTEEKAQAYLQSCGLSASKLDEKTINQRVIDCITNGGVVGWVQGRSEWGPRALGNRSILADPRRSDMKEILNQKIKRRESFRPFAPSVLSEYASDWFVLDSSTQRIPYMEKVVPVLESKAGQIPAVVHYDGTARAQLVEKEMNARYWSLINAMGERTGVPILLNTSFNENEPIVETAEHAIECFRRTGMDMLVIGDLVLER